MEEKNKRLEFGKKYRVGNFFVFKYNKVLRKSEVAELRMQMGIPKEEWKKLQRSQLPFLKIEAVSGVWAVEFCCNTSIYQFIDQLLSPAIEAYKAGVKLESNDLASFAHMFNHMYMDTVILGDGIYHADKANALKAFMERQKAAEVSEEQEKETLEDLQADEEAKATIVDMAQKIKEGGGDDGK